MAIYAKTAKGRTEVASPSGNLTPKFRRLLILSNGQLDEQSLCRSIGADDARDMLRLLESEGYITKLDIDQGASKLYADLADLPATRSQAEFTKAKNYMVNTITHFHGQYGYLALKNEINAASSVGQLREHYPDWANAIEKFKQFKKLKKDLLKVL